LLSRDTMLALQKELLERFRCPFDVWQLESTLHESNAVPKTLEHLKRSGHTFEEGGALWLKSSEMGDDKDRVLVKQDGSLTYLTADVAYHDAKYKRPENFTKLVNIWGADHHGYIPRIKASMMALGHDASKLEIILGQLVSLIVSGERTRMGKRKTMQQLDEIMDDVGVDATRFWLVSRSADSTIEFDVDLAGSASQDNPVFYTQYAHARASGILRNAFSPTLNTETGEESPARFTQEQFYAYKSSVVSEDWANFLLTSIKDDPAYSKVRETLLLLISFAERVEDAGRVSSPHVIARYALELAGDFHSLYAGCRVLCDDDDQAMARLLLVDALRTTLAQSLDLLGVTAPESM
jgi:arginyl-tRNA synthetase